MIKIVIVIGIIFLLYKKIKNSNNNEIKVENSKNDNRVIISSIEDIEKLEDNTKLEDNIKEYELPDINLIKNEKSKSFVDSYNFVKNSESVLIPIGTSEKRHIAEELQTMPNMLVGGTVMSGKTTFINSIISSILMTKKPDEIKLIIFDSKSVDYSIYNGIPHLLCPVIDKTSILLTTLKRMNDEIERRTKIIKTANVNSVKKYNDMIPLNSENKKISTILIIIDDLTNLNDLEEINKEIENISLNGWNVNVNMIISANHPSTKVISTISKANFPARLSFKVVNSQASKIIINKSGAEKLLGIGNALYVSRMNDQVINIKIPYICDEDIERIVYYIKEQQPADYSFQQKGLNNDNAEYDDPLYNEVVEFVIKSGKTSASLLQRKFRLGYNRTARLIDLLEERGIVGPPNVSKPREVLVKYEEDN